MGSFEEMPQEVVPRQASSEQVEKEMWEQRMPQLLESLKDVPEGERDQVTTLFELANGWMKKNKKQAV